MTNTVTRNSRSRQGSAPARVHTPRRDIIIEAAAQCFARWGVVRTRMEDVARQSGVPRPVLYRHFAGKEALVVEVMIRHIGSRSATLREQVPLVGPAGPLVAEVLRIGIEGDGGPFSTVVLGDDAVHDTARLVAGNDRIFEAMDEYWRPYLDYARDRGELRPEVELTQAVRWLTLIVFHFLSLPETVPPEEELVDYLRTFVVAAIVSS